MPILRFLFLAISISFISPLLQAQTSPCVRDTAFHIVVLGSSTAQGAGASTPDSAWVNRYRDYLQGINPAYQVTNRAVGGFTTYRLMPTGFLPPVSRPNPDTTRNITAGIALNPDAIIVNLPSNDVSSGYTVQEQLDNFDTIVNHALAAGIPIWLTTTQPRFFNGQPVPIGQQIAVRDSLYARYSPFVIDFWTGLADSSNQLATPYNSGDGTHLNDAGHGLAFSRVANADLPGYLFQAPTFTDYVAADLYPSYAPICGDSFAQFQVVLYNRGSSNSNPLQINLQVENLSNLQTTSYSNTLPGGLINCQEDTLTFQVNTAATGSYRFTAIIAAAADSNAQNDTVTYTATFLGQPSLVGIPDTGCNSSTLTLQAIADPGDSIRWYDAAIAGTFMGGGPTFTTPALSGSTTYFAEALRGEFFFRNQIEGATHSTINYNGTMFDLVADSALILDSFAVKVNTTGPQAIIAHTRAGSHLGFETNAAAWTPRGIFPVSVSSPNVPVTFATGGWAMNPGDTLAIYLQMQNGTSRLSYRPMSQPITRVTPELQMITGSGASFNFGGNFYPRDWNGNVYYHFGNKPEADCKSERIAVEALISSAAVDLGVDTILSLNSTYTLNAGAGLSQYAWSTGAVSQTILLDGNVLGAGIYVISVTVTDSAGCTGMDEVIVVFAPLVGIEDAQLRDFKIWPNPSMDKFNLKLPQGKWTIKVMDLQGRIVKTALLQGSAASNQEIETKNWPEGIYILEARQEELILRRQIVKMN